MSWDEIVGLTLTAALVGGAVGAAISAMVARSGAARAMRQEHTTQTYARWLAARLTFSRASASFVAAFRALATERRDSPQFPLRREEALRSRVTWSEASRDLDYAEAMLLVIVCDPAIDRKLGEFRRVSAEALRDVVAGDLKGVEEWLQELHTADQHALDFVRAATAKARGKRPIWRKGLAHLMTPIRRMIDRWSRG